jgi:SNF2 family DNA or RNA helicase
VEVIDSDTIPDRFGRRLPKSKTDCLIVSYNYVTDKRHAKWLLENYRLDCIICDEFHFCKSLKSKRSKYTLLLMRAADVKLALTGTPYTKNVMDLYPQLIPFADEKDIGKSFVEFGYKFSYLVDNGFGRYFEGLQNEKELIRIQRKFARRRLKKDVLKELPPLTLSNIYIDIPASIAKESLKYVDVALEQITGQSHYVDPELKDHVASMKRQLGLSKCRGAVEYIMLLTETIEHLVVFAYHKDVISVLKKSLREKKITCRCITGATASNKRDLYIKNFQKGKYAVLLCQISTGGIGITLTRASRGVITELDWSAATIEQAAARLHRIGQESRVQIDFLIARNSLDQEIIASLKNKIRLSKRALGDV